MPDFWRIGIRIGRVSKRYRRVTKRRVKCAHFDFKFGTPFAANWWLSKGSSWKFMQLFGNWWERAPLYVRIALFAATVVGMVLGGSASGYWD
jgi:hypothetical protein